MPSALLTFFTVMQYAQPPDWMEDVSAAAGIVVWLADPSLSRFRYLSRGFGDVWGAPPDDLLEDADAFFAAILEDDDEGDDGPVQPPRERLGRPVPWEFRIRRPDGGIRWIRNLGGPVVGPDGAITGFAGIARDITAEKEAEARHRRSQVELAAVFRALPDLVLVVNDEGRYLRIVSGDPRQLYRPEQDLTGRTFHEVFPEEIADRFLHAVHEVVERGDRVALRYPLDIGDRTEWFDAILVPMGPRQVLWVARTITDRVLLEHQLAHANRLDALGQLAGGIAHDFNNVITVIRGTTSLIAERLEDPGLLADLGDIRGAADRASSLTRQLLAFSRQQVLQPERVRVTEVIEPMARMLSRIIGENIDLSITTTGAPGAVMIDAGQLEQIVANLVVNARHAIRGAGEIRIDVSEVEVEPGDELVESGALQPGPHVSLEVVDDGSGMPPAVVERAFEPFFTTKSAGEGTGLGLSMVYGTVRQSGGHIQIESREGLGTSVRILLPEVPANETAPRDPAVAMGPDRQATILVVEDERSVRRLVRRFLEGAGHTVHEVDNGEEALEWLGEGAEVDVILTDVIMPRMGGAQLLRAVREAWPGTPVIVMSGYTGRELRAHDGVRDADAFLAKPFNRSDLLRAIQTALDGAKGGATE
jgi:PAS domain S-box-containing protein